MCSLVCDGVLTLRNGQIEDDQKVAAASRRVDDAVRGLVSARGAVTKAEMAFPDGCIRFPL